MQGWLPPAPAFVSLLEASGMSCGLPLSLSLMQVCRRAQSPANPTLHAQLQRTWPDPTADHAFCPGPFPLASCARKKLQFQKQLSLSDITLPFSYDTSLLERNSEH